MKPYHFLAVMIASPLLLTAQTPLPPVEPAPPTPAIAAVAPIAPMAPLPPAALTLSAMPALGMNVDAWPGSSDFQMTAAQQDAMEKAQADQDTARAAMRKSQLTQVALQRYQMGLDAINNARWQTAEEEFQEAADAKGANADASLYWQAYAASKLGQVQQALDTLKQFQDQYPNSDWKQDVAALDMQLKQLQGQPVNPYTQGNDDLKLLAINGIMQSDPATATPLLVKVVEGHSSDTVKSRALFVLAQNHSSDAITALVKVAESPTDPALGMLAVRYLGMSGGEAGRNALAQVYGSSPSPDVKSAIIRAYGNANDLDHLLPLVKNETNPELRRDAIRYLGYAKSPEAQQALVNFYTGASDRSQSETIIRALSSRRGDTALIALARKETDPGLKQDIVRELSNMHTPAATAYLMEILNQ